MLAYVPAVLILIGMAAYTVLAGADFGAGLWTLLSRSSQLRSHARHAMGPVWEANHVWLIFVLVICWTAYPVAFGSIASTLAAPLLIAAIGIIFRGAAYALRGVVAASRFAENLFALSSILTPFALGTAIGAIATGRVPVGNAAGNLLTSWLNPASVLIGVLAVSFSGYLAAVYLAADARRFSVPAELTAAAEHDLESAFRTRALWSGLVSGALALAGVLVLHSSLNLLHGAPLAMVIVSGVFGLATLALCWRWLFGPARATAALAVAAVVAGWAFAQSPRLLPGLSITEAAAGRSTLIAVVIGVGVGLLILIPSLLLLFTLLLRGRLDTPAGHEDPVAAAEAAVAAPAAPAAAGPAAAAPAAGGPAAAGPSARSRRRQQLTGMFALGCVIAGAILMVFGPSGLEIGIGVACLIACAVATFSLAAVLPQFGPPSLAPEQAVS